MIYQKKFRVVTPQAFVSRVGVSTAHLGVGAIRYAVNHGSQSVNNYTNQL
ncbi:MAG: hypothetical protein RMY64_05450 [Nostoc sp. DedQUE08]|nr:MULTISPECIES: hypothetical protein [unclassified Nostoc]MDZ8065074.1 hypothetical protein [Nostoc sp. DedQUE08]MDZ8096486.1 hypothetical protein [Nostoc sp. DedQUE05]MDZ8127260.1 hypothetical protein [Nostoc sp. DedQUE07]